MSRPQLLAIVAVLLLALGVGYLALRNRQPPLLPMDEEHARYPGAPPCMECHGPDSVFPKDENHPLGDDCFRCHGVR